eukprot:COSAG02_NODE_54159_length_297_cov_1.308081_1_plen_86_part_10
MLSFQVQRFSLSDHRRETPAIQKRDALFNQLVDHGICKGKRQVLRAMTSEWPVTSIKDNNRSKKIPKKCKHFYALDAVWKRLQKEL